MKRTLEELKEMYKEEGFQNRFRTLFSLRTLFNSGIINNTAAIDPKLCELIVLTESGKKLLEKLKENKFGDTEERFLIFKIFSIFYCEELFIDVDRTDILGLMNTLSTQMLNDNIQFPWIYGKLLYDKYFDEFEGEDDKLFNKDAQKLLHGTPKGVFQVGDLVVGPLGILEAPTTRYIPSTKEVNLWHCSDPSCTAFHSVEFLNVDSVLKEITVEVKRLLEVQKKSEWRRYFSYLIQPEDYFYDIDRLAEIPLLLINAFGNSEIKEILRHIIDNNKNFRSNLPATNRFKGSSQTIIDKLNKAECFQLLLLEADRELVKSLEYLILNKKIFIPATEIRKSNFNLFGGAYEVYHECNQLGVRSMSSLANISVTRLLNFIEKVNLIEGSKADLEWRLMEYKKETFKETIENYILQEEPKKVIKEALLFGPRQTAKTIDLLVGNFQKPTTESELNLLVDKVLWKLGFDVKIYPSALTNFWQELQLLKKVASISSDANFSDSEKQDIRSAAVNFFVLLEEVLEHSLAYCTWLLLSDHYFVTKFRYNFEEALGFMCEKLNGIQVGSNDPLRFDASGNNTLFPLIEGFMALIEKCESLKKEGAEKYRRPDAEVPHFYNKSDLNIFPFLSKIFLFDIKDREYQEFKGILHEMHQEFNRHGVLSVRNKIEHKERYKATLTSFPTPKQVMDACNCIETVFKKVEEKGLFPNVFLFESRDVDLYNRNSYKFKDYKGRVKVINPIPQFFGCQLPRYLTPQLISSIVTIGASTENIRFKFEESSEYLKFWKRFPRKKVRGSIRSVEGNVGEELIDDDVKELSVEEVKAGVA